MAAIGSQKGWLNTGSSGRGPEVMQKQKKRL